MLDYCSRHNNTQIIKSRLTLSLKHKILVESLDTKK